MISQKENENCDVESDDERTPFQVKAVRAHHNKRSKCVVTIAAIAYLILGAFYIKLWTSFRILEYQVRTLEPELFPCVSFDVLYCRTC